MLHYSVCHIVSEKSLQETYDRTRSD
ncbi:erythrose 4-phosphate dehydrogenase [Citrobacter freundii]|uniref:Erythrose 4-phosphate dehydrogenase n=2 Tax=Citrobacter TaxID=544 RepID=A0AB33HAG7_CITFR|nr:erythrose 4-phosphate dehydrogenase [Citrobacter freundii]AUV29014.1 erythrose 4-phosphate dehydrogenase [Citrobacter freundii complex sp. CFNIH3]AUV45919.1 erythrose 4-phosphate dehydrogenase [Citrobacter freundii complex sp. CFNIH9]AUZ72630.1 erythrose 4-phosphate dehydrogenase [Citrobacter freundii complex sp. CFNIH4]AVH82109.1 erythrose 4-phosphate dehydrogenase [Citrobacter sp. FDAARGOS_156]AVH83850.1 erythrose 4-phosphate dehydrogenase [Citrobacter braakii]AWS98537.1 erythrose 4-phos